MRLVCVIIISFIITGVICCKKSEKDSVTENTIRGVVINNCTDSGLAGVTVFLQTFEDNKKLVNQVSTISEANGKFVFENIEIHSNDKFNYALHIESKSGTAAQTPEFCGFDGATMYFFKDEIDMEFKPRVTPRFLFMTLQIDKSVTTSDSDSILVMFYQKTFQKNSKLPHSFGGSAYGNQKREQGTVSTYPMGRYDIVVDKWETGSHFVTRDSIYLSWKDTKTYTVNW